MSFMCVLFCVVSGCGPDIVLTTHSGRLALCILRVCWSIVCCSPYRPLNLGHLDCKSRGAVVRPKLGEVKEQRKKEKKILRLYKLFQFSYLKTCFILP